MERMGKTERPPMRQTILEVPDGDTCVVGDIFGWMSDGG